MGKLISLNEAVQKSSRLRNRKYVLPLFDLSPIVGMTNGCFDLLHLGHFKILEFAKSKCDVLFVGVNTDASVKSLKGNARPLNPEKDRAEMLCYHKDVDFVFLFDFLDSYDAFKKIAPHVFIKGNDYEGKLEREERESDVRYYPIDDRSTSKILAKAVENE
tara:strand:- start:398 stop:880 length:483 start_codon:yes stop_codon:yes gene_type:complete